MAQTIVTICDKCGSPDLGEVGTDITSFIINGNVIDLCPEDAAQMSFYDGAVLANTLGRKAEQNGTKPKRVRKPKAEQPEAPRKTTLAFACPYCDDKTGFASRRGANAHIGQKHKGQELLT